LGNCAFCRLVKEDKGVKHVNANGSEGSGGQLKTVIDNLRGHLGVYPI
jgi:hypothetical protein